MYSSLPSSHNITDETFKDSSRMRLNSSCWYLLFGAKFTQIYSARHGSHFKPKSGAEEVTLKVWDSI